MVNSTRIHGHEVPALPPAAQRVIVGDVTAGGLYGVRDSSERGLVARLIRAGTSRIEVGLGQSFIDSINETFLIAALIGVVAAAASLFVAEWRTLGSRSAQTNDRNANSEGGTLTAVQE